MELGAIIYFYYNYCRHVMDCVSLSPPHCLSVTKESGYSTYQLKNIKCFRTQHNGFKFFVKMLDLEQYQSNLCSDICEKLFGMKRNEYVIRSE
jgi:hypothetical protein